jgi:hypothetical protein
MQSQGDIEISNRQPHPIPTEDLFKTLNQDADPEIYSELNATCY